MGPLVQLRSERSSAARGALERVAADEQPLDYVLTPYAPPASPAGKLASKAVLREAFALAGVEVEGMALVELLERGLGRGRTVYGIKHRGPDEPLSFELYFYDRDLPGPKLSLERVVEALAPRLRVDAALDRPVDWLMFSVEVTADDLRTGTAPGVTLYVKGEDLSYDLRGRTLTMGNLYRFFDPGAEIRKVLGALEECVHYDPRGPDLGRILPPRLLRAHHVCVARKRTADGMYFSRVPLPSLRWFLEAFGWPSELRAFVARHARDLDWLLHDVGYDFRLEGGVLSFTKSGFYGYF